MRLACAYLEGKNVDTVTEQVLQSANGTSNGTVMPADASLKVSTLSLKHFSCPTISFVSWCVSFEGLCLPLTLPS